MENEIRVVGPDGMESTVEILDIFQVEKYDGKDYVLQTQNKEIDNNNVEVFVSILKEDGENFSLLNIEDEEEWKDVQKALDEMGEV